MSEIPKCVCGCGTLIESRGKSGPRKQYATPACRMRASRNRKMGIEITPLPDIIRDAPTPMSGRPTDEQVQIAILEAKTIAFVFLRLGLEARPELAARCTIIGNVIRQTLSDNFGDRID